MPRAALASAFVLLAALLAALSLSVTATADAATPCWHKILDDWSDNGKIDGRYPDSCYVAALKNLPRDVRHYSDAVDEIESARLAKLRDDNRVPSSVGPESVGGGGTGGGNGNGPSSGGEGDDDGPLGRLLNFAPNAVGDAPVPLLALAGVALLLMAAGGAGLLSRHLQAKRADAASGPGGDPGEPPA